MLIFAWMAYGILFGFVLAAGLIFYRKYKIENLPLRKNCLLTQKPLLVLDSKKSIFSRLFSAQIQLHEYLFAHGYECIQLPIEKNPSALKRSRLSHQLQQIAINCGGIHVLNNCDQLDLRRQIHLAHCLSVTDVHNHKPQQVLDIAISLAENEIQCSH